MIRKLALTAVLVVAACDDVVQPKPEPIREACPGECGPTDLEIVEYEIEYPRTERIIYSGDTLRVHLHIRNNGPLAADSTAFVGASLDPGIYGATESIAYLRPGQSVRKTLLTSAQLVHSDSVRRTARLFITAFNYGDPNSDNDTYSIRDLAFRPTFMTLSGPDTIHVGREYTYNLRIVNPAPRPLLPATIGVCYLYYSCATTVFLRVKAPYVPATSTVEIPLRFVMPAPFARSLPLSGGAIAACYGPVGASSECGWRRIAFFGF